MNTCTTSRSAGPRALLWGLLLALMAAGATRAETLDLAGSWRFALDRTDAGEAQRWYERTLDGKVTLPGTLAAQGIGDPVTVETKWIGGIIDKSWFTAPEYEPYRRPGNVKVPFWLQPEWYYAGAAWYQRDVTVPPGWQGRRVVLVLERPHWETRVWLGSRLIGTDNALATPHEHDLGVLAPGTHRLTMRVDNRMIVDVGENSHSVSDHTQGNWNGIAGRIELRATATAWIEDLQVFPAAGTGEIRVAGRVAGRDQPEIVMLEVKSARQRPTAARVDRTSGRFEAKLDLGSGAARWDEFSPALHVLTATLSNGEARTVRFGLRDFAAAGTQFAINGRTTFLRGTLDCGNYPRTGHPPMDVAEWKRIIGIVKAHGLNLVRFHSWCPPEAAFVAADELGCYLHVEASIWPNHSTSLGDDKPIDRWLYEETDRILRAYGNHPSFVLMAAGNEPGGRQHRAYLSKWLTHYRGQEPRRLFTSGAGWPELPENQWHNTPKPRIHAWGDGLKSRINAQPPETVTDYRAFVGARPVPVVSHEIGQWCAFPNFAEMAKYTGYLKPRNFEIFQETLRAHGLEHQAERFLQASGRLQTLCYKEDIESALRTPGMAGFELLDLHDFPGQGTALVGVLDAFWEQKGYVTPAEYRRFCQPTVPLARLSRRVFTSEDTLVAGIEVAHFGPAPLAGAVVAWKLVGDGGKVHGQGHLPAQTLGLENGRTLGEVRQPLASLPAPARYRLVVGIANTEIENDWDVWVYPARLETAVPAGVLVVSELDATALAALDAGGRVLLQLPPTQVRNDPKQKVELGFSSIFWNTAWTRRQAPTTLGILCDPRHPALAEFPTEFHSNWQWWYLVSQAGAMILDSLPRELAPLVQVVDDWVTGRKLGLVFEARVRQGRLLVCSIDLGAGASGRDNPVARQLRHSLLRYMAGVGFNPKVTVPESAIAQLRAP